MILNKLYTTPKELFKPITFHNGLNIIFAHKDENGNSGSSVEVDSRKSSLHAVGKSTVLDLISFALLSDFSESSSHRLYNAYEKKILHGISVVLDFSIGNTNYQIKRSFDHPNKDIYFGSLDMPRTPHPLIKLREQLFNLLFYRKDFPDSLNSYWYQKLLSFFIKVKKRDDLFSDPIDFSRNLSDLDFVPFHFFLLNIDNSIPSEHRDISEDISKLDLSLKDNEKLLKENFKTNDIDKIRNMGKKLTASILKLDTRIAEFKLTEDYKELETQADELTKEIKKLWFDNVVDRNKLSELHEYDKILPSDAHDDLDKITSIYNEVNSLLAGNIKKDLDDAILFRKAILSSRKEFADEEEGRLNSNILLRNQKIEAYESDRKKLFVELSNQKALTDLTNAYTRLTKLQIELTDINTSLKNIDKISKSISDKHDEHAKVLDKVNDYLESILPAVNHFRGLLSSISGKLFLDSHEIKIFDITETDTKQKLKISLLEGSIMDSTGINQVRTLVYDIAVLLNSINQNLSLPCFIAHDGIFENLHKDHFFEFIKYIHELLDNKYEFQYILTLNDHDYFDEIKDFRQHNIDANTIIELTPTHTLFGKNF